MPQKRLNRALGIIKLLMNLKRVMVKYLKLMFLRVMKNRECYYNHLNKIIYEEWNSVMFILILNGLV